MAHTRPGLTMPSLRRDLSLWRSARHLSHRPANLDALSVAPGNLAHFQSALRTFVTDYGYLYHYALKTLCNGRRCSHSSVACLKAGTSNLRFLIFQHAVCSGNFNRNHKHSTELSAVNSTTCQKSLHHRAKAATPKTATYPDPEPTVYKPYTPI